jgi:hypothetical protein
VDNFFFLFFSSWGSRTREPPNLLYRPINTPPHLTITTKQTTDGRAQVCLTFLSSLSSLSSLPHYSPTTTLPIAFGKYLPTGSQPRRPPSSSTCDVPWMPCPLDPLFFPDRSREGPRRFVATNRAPTPGPVPSAAQHIPRPSFNTIVSFPLLLRIPLHIHTPHHTTLHYTVLPCIHLSRLHH